MRLAKITPQRQSGDGNERQFRRSIHRLPPSYRAASENAIGAGKAPRVVFQLVLQIGRRDFVCDIADSSVRPAWIGWEQQAQAWRGWRPSRPGRPKNAPRSPATAPESSEASDPGRSDHKQWLSYAPLTRVRFPAASARHSTRAILSHSKPLKTNRLALASPRGQSGAKFAPTR